MTTTPPTRPGQRDVAANLRAFQIALNAHDRENPTHTAHGIGLAHFDMERLGFDEGEEVLPGITIHADGGVTGNFRVLCDGEHATRRRRTARFIERDGAARVRPAVDARDLSPIAEGRHRLGDA